MDETLPSRKCPHYNHPSHHGPSPFQREHPSNPLLPRTLILVQQKSLPKFREKGDPFKKSGVNKKGKIISVDIFELIFINSTVPKPPHSLIT